MLLIGITGAIGHGKSLLAEAFTELEPTAVHLESSGLITEVANAMQALLPNKVDPEDAAAIQAWLYNLPPVLRDITHCDAIPEQLRIDALAYAERSPEYTKLHDYLVDMATQPDRRSAQINPGNKELYRHILQWYGGFLVSHVNRGIWYDELVRRAQTRASTASSLAVIGGVRFPSDAEIIRNASGLVIEITRPNAPINDITDPTEALRASIVPDILVVNDGGIDNITACAEKILHDITTGKRRDTYHTVAYGALPHATRYRLH